MQSLQNFLHIYIDIHLKLFFLLNFPSKKYAWVIFVYSLQFIKCWNTTHKKDVDENVVAYLMDVLYTYESGRSEGDIFRHLTWTHYSGLVW